jgi:uncharacterized membrane protein
LDHPKRSFIKSVTWRVVALVTTMIAVYIYSKDLKQSLVVGISANLVKFFLYYLHERLWEKVEYGRKQLPEYEI